MNLRPLCLVFALMGLQTAVQAAMFKCTAPDGRTAFQDMPCASDIVRPQDRRDPVPGQKNEEFTRSKPVYHDASDGSFDPRRPVATPSQVAPPPSTLPLDPNAPRALAGDDPVFRCNQARKNIGVLRVADHPGYYTNGGAFREVGPGERAGFIAQEEQKIERYCSRSRY